MYAKGEVIPTLIHHIPLSILLCFAVLFLLNNIVESNKKTEKIINIILLIWLVYFIHILSVRTGILLLYISIILFAFSNLIQQKRIVFAASLILFIIASAYFSYQKIPTIKSKIAYSIYGLQQLNSNTDTSNQVSDTRRILSDKIGIEIIKKNKVFGVGFGDIKQEMNEIYKQQFPSFKKDVYARIHNQYLYVTASVGLVFGFIFCILLFFPFIQFIKDKNVVFAISYLLLLLIMCWESFIENQIGNSIFLVICSLGFVSKKDA